MADFAAAAVPVPPREPAEAAAAAETAEEAAEAAAAAATPDSIRALAADARWLMAYAHLEAHEAAAGAPLVGAFFDEVRARGVAFRTAKAQCDGGGEGWSLGHSYLGVDTFFRRADGELWLKTQGAMEDVDIFCTVGVLREVELFKEWMPFMRSVSLVKEVDFSRLMCHFSLGVPALLTRDCVLRVAACNAALEDAALYFEGASPEDGETEWEGAAIPKYTTWFNFNRMRVVALNACIKFTSPTSQFVQVVVAVDLRLTIPAPLLDFFLKKLVGVFLVLWRRQSRFIAADADSPHRVEMERDHAFYRDWLWPKYLEFCNKQGWDRPTPPVSIDDGLTTR
ncbi:hypothetical protein M885DRAFT_544426 [Pelagophyceae sp. CCMP2097]|nr:hypothetical protein M885DRAFT_544426 [Pelagophyceae sp. CCMP2097]